MASIGTRVLSEIIRGRVLHAALKAGLVESLFKNYSERAVFRLVHEHFRSPMTMGQYPTLDTIQRQVPSFRMVHIPDDEGQIETRVGELREAVLRDDAFLVSKKYDQLLNANELTEAINYLKVESAKLSTVYGYGRGGFGLEEIVKSVKDSYKAAQDGSSNGIPWLWPTLTDDSRGKRPGDFIVFYGRMKSMKTWLSVASAVHDFKTFNKRVMFWSKEMSEEQIKLRMGSVFAEVDYQLLKKGQLPGDKFAQALNRLEELAYHFNESVEEKERMARKGAADIIVLAGRDAPVCLEFEDKDNENLKRRGRGTLYQAIEDWQPDIVYLDSFYHIRDIRADSQRQVWARILYLAEAVKDMATYFNIPVVANCQANREGEKLQGENLSEVAGGDAIARESDLIMRVLRKLIDGLDEEEYEGIRQEEIEQFKKLEEAQANLKTLRRDKSGRAGVPLKASWKAGRPLPEPLKRKGAELCLRLGGNRDGTLEAFTLKCIPGYDFSVINPSLNGKEIKDWLSQDDAAADAQKRAFEVGGKGTHPKIGKFTAPAKTKK